LSDAEKRELRADAVARRIRERTQALDKDDFLKMHGALLHLALVMDDDPGSDLGRGRQPGHRFFYAPDEIELLPEAQA